MSSTTSPMDSRANNNKAILMMAVAQAAKAHSRRLVWDAMAFYWGRTILDEADLHSQIQEAVAAIEQSPEQFAGAYQRMKAHRVSQFQSHHPWLMGQVFNDVVDPTVPT